MISVNGVKITPTIFPDKTSQVWKLPKDLLDTIYKEGKCIVMWEFESEAEFLHIAQLKTLLDTYCPNVSLDMPYLPYARQDKRIDNDATFSLFTFGKLLNTLDFTRVRVVDAHNLGQAHVIRNLDNVSANDFIQEAIRQVQPNAIIFPDEGAKKRYSRVFVGSGLQLVHATKVRDQASGAITSLKFEGDVKGKILLIVDDLCDGGATFKRVAELALKDGAKEVHLYVSHGIFSRGLETLRESGIIRVFTYKGECPRVTVPIYDGGH